MSDTAKNSEQSPETPAIETSLATVGPAAIALNQQSLTVESLGIDHVGVEVIKVAREDFIPVAKALYEQGV